MDLGLAVLQALDEAIPAIRAGIINEHTIKLCNTFDLLKNSATATRGTQGEMPVFQSIGDGFILKRMPDDPTGLRISIGEISEKLIPVRDVERTYLVYRGDEAKIVHLLDRAVKALRNTMGIQR